MEGSVECQILESFKPGISLAAKRIVMASLAEKGPLGMLEEVIKRQQKVLIVCAKGRKIHCQVKAYDMHWNLVLYDVFQFWNDLYYRRNGQYTERPYNMTKSTKWLILRGDAIVAIIKEPLKVFEAEISPNSV